MVTSTLQETATVKGTQQAGETDMYRAFMTAGAGGEPNGDRSYGFEVGGNGPPPGGSGQPPQGGGGYEGPPGGLLGGGYGGPPGGPLGGGGGWPGGGNVGANPVPVPQVGQPPVFMNGGLKGTVPANFDGNRKNTKQFTQEFSLYRMINQDSVTMRNPYTRVALALSFMRGPAINDWVLQQTERLYVQCNGDLANSLAPMHQTHDERLWAEFGHNFRWAFMDTASEQ